MDPEVLTTGVILKVLLTAAAGALLGWVPAMFMAARTERFAREREIWKRDADRCDRLEEAAGELVDRFGAYGIRPEEYGALGGKIAALGTLSGKFPRHPRIQKAVRDLRNTLDRMWADRNQYSSMQEREEILKELRDRQAALLSACSEAVGRGQPGLLAKVRRRIEMVTKKRGGLV
jgi:hypothetical protein